MCATGKRKAGQARRVRGKRVKEDKKMTVKTNELSDELFLRLYTSVGFYQKHGFEERPCDRGGLGMFKMIR